MRFWNLHPTQGCLWCMPCSTTLTCGSSFHYSISDWTPIAHSLRGRSWTSSCKTLGATYTEYIWPGHCLEGVVMCNVSTSHWWQEHGDRPAWLIARCGQLLAPLQYSSIEGPSWGVSCPMQWGHENYQAPGLSGVGVEQEVIWATCEDKSRCTAMTSILHLLRCCHDWGNGLHAHPCGTALQGYHASISWPYASIKISGF